MMDHHIKFHLRPTNRTELQVSISKALDYLLKDMKAAYENALKSFPSRIRLLREKNGGSILK